VGTMFRDRPEVLTVVFFFVNLTAYFGDRHVKRKI
jgi:hypothetical protein